MINLELPDEVKLAMSETDAPTDDDTKLSLLATKICELRDEAVRYAGERRQHGKIIAGHQLIAAMLAEMATEVDAARLLVHRAAQMFDAGVGAEMEAAMAKSFACEAAVRVTRQAVQIHGANGVTRDFLVEKLARESIICTIPEGTTQIQQLIIARSLTGVAAF